jgi:hypothetical protein
MPQRKCNLSFVVGKGTVPAAVVDIAASGGSLSELGKARTHPSAHVPHIFDHNFQSSTICFPLLLLLDKRIMESFVELLATKFDRFLNNKIKIEIYHF